jgi:hypothetical protein
MPFNLEEFKKIWSIQEKTKQEMDNTMKRVNKGFERANKGFEGGTLVTQEEVVKLKKLLWRDLVYLDAHGFRNFIGTEAEPIVDRMWAEVQDLRSKLTKQIY